MGSQNYLGTTFAGKIGFSKRKSLIMRERLFKVSMELSKMSLTQHSQQ
jgi:hypothetical protein